MPRYCVETRRQIHGTGRKRKDEDGKEVQICTSTYSEIKLVDTKKVWPDVNVPDVAYAQKICDAMNAAEE